MSVIMDLSQGDTILLNMNEYPQKEVTIKHVYNEKNNYTILNNRNASFFDDTQHFLFRSVICSYPEKKVLCFSPPSVSHVSKFKANENLPYLLVNEAVEGVMINLFYDFRCEKWEIATKSGVGGHYCYNKYKKQKHLLDHSSTKSFYIMFMEALRCSETKDLNDIEFLKFFSKNISYSFVLQHPENIICLPITNIKLYLVSMYSINNKSGNIAEIRYINPLHFRKWWFFQSLSGIIEFPEVYESQSVDTQLFEYPSIHETVKNRGKMITNIKTGERYVVENIEYTKLFLRRGQKNLLNYTYLCLERIGKATDYLYYSPKYKKAFRRAKNGLYEFITNVYLSYVNKFILKRKINISDKYEKHIDKLHKEIFIPSLRKGNTKVKITETIVRDYFLEMEPHILFYHLS